jgi:hypothetical protein
MRTPSLVALSALALSVGAAIVFSDALFPATVAQPVAVSPADAQTTAIVAAADAFLATLDATQRDTALYDWGDATQRANWSNLPIDMVARGGLAWGDMTADQRAALTALLGTVLSPDGLSMVQRQMAADDVLRAAEEAGEGPGLTFGSDHYYVSFLGTPTTDTAWTMQFGGHHLALNATIAGPDVTLAPSLTGGQPLTLTVDGAEVWIVGPEVTAVTDLLGVLDADQLTTAVQGTDPIDLVLGPGEDGQTVDAVGLSGSAMNAQQKAALLAVMATRAVLLNPDDQAALMTTLEGDLDQTFFAYWGPTDDPANASWRVTGPRVVQEFSGQSMGGSLADHAHNMWRDPLNDYGALWTTGN